MENLDDSQNSQPDEKFKDDALGLAVHSVLLEYLKQKIEHIHKEYDSNIDFWDGGGI